MSETQVAVQSRGPGNTHREGTYHQLGSPAMRMRVSVCLHMQTNGSLFNTYTHPTDPPIAHLRGQHNNNITCSIKLVPL